MRVEEGVIDACLVHGRGYVRLVRTQHTESILISSQGLKVTFCHDITQRGQQSLLCRRRGGRGGWRCPPAEGRDGRQLRPYLGPLRPHPRSHLTTPLPLASSSVSLSLSLTRNDTGHIGDCRNVTMATAAAPTRTPVHSFIVHQQRRSKVRILSAKQHINQIS